MRLKKLLQFAVLLCAIPMANAQGAHRISQIISRGQGVQANIAPNAKVLVCAQGTNCVTTVQVYSDIALNHIATNPVTSDLNGNFNYYIAPGCYDERYTYPGSPAQMVYNVCLHVGGGEGGTVTNFSSGNLTPLFTTSVTNPTTTPALSFSLSSAANDTFYGNFSGSTGAPSFWTLAAGSNITLTPNTGTKTLTVAATGGGSGCSISGITPGAVLFPNTDSTQCLGSDNITADGVVGGVNGADTLIIKTPAIATGDDFNIELLSAVDPNNNESDFAPHLWQMDCTNSGTSSLGCGIALNASDSGRPDGTTGGLTPLWIKMNATQTGNHPGYIGVEIDQSAVDGVSAPNSSYVGVNIDGPRQGTFRSIEGYDYLATFDAISNTVYSGFHSYDQQGGTIPANWCAFLSTDSISTFTSIDCTSTHASTFYGPVTVADTGGNPSQINLIQNGVSPATVANGSSIAAAATVTTPSVIVLPDAPCTGYLRALTDTSGVMPITCGTPSGGGFPITLGSTSVAASSTTTAVAGLALTTSSINGVTPSTSAGSGNFLNGAGGYSSPGGISVKIKYVSVEGCPQDTDLTAGGGTDATACINALWAGASPTNPILVYQDGASLLTGNGLLMPAGGGAFLQGNGGGISTVDITNCSLTSNVATFTTKPNVLITGQHVQVANLGTCAALNNVVLQVISTGLSSTQFEANFTHANIASGAETGVGVTVYGTGFFMANNNGVSGNMISNGFPLVGTNCDVAEATVPSRGANFGISNLVLNGSSGGDYCSSIAIGNANDILVDNVVFYRPQAHSIWLANTGQVVLRANKVYVPLSGAESDGYHIEGPDNDLAMTDNYFNTTDDAIALNAREGYCGPITRVAISNSTVENSLHMLRAYTNVDTCVNGLVPKQSSITIDGFSGNASDNIANFGFDAIPTLTDAVTDFKWSNSVLNAEGQGAFVFTENAGRMDFDNVTVKGVSGCVFCSNGVGGVGDETIALLKLHNFSVVGTADSLGFPSMLYAVAGGGTLTATDLIVDGLGYYNDAGGTYSADCPFCLGAVTNMYAANIDMNLFNTFADSHVTNLQGSAGPNSWAQNRSGGPWTFHSFGAGSGFDFWPHSGAGGSYNHFFNTSHLTMWCTDNNNNWIAFGGLNTSQGCDSSYGAEPIFITSGTINWNRQPGVNGPVFGSAGDWTWYHAASGTASADCIHMAAQAFGAGGYSDVLVPCADWSVRTKNNTLDDGSGNASIAGSTALTGGISTNVPIGACGGTNCQINFGTNYGALDIAMYDGGAAQRYGWGLTAGTMNFVVPSLANSGGHVKFTDGGDLGAGSSMFTVTRAASSLPSAAVMAFSNSTDASGTLDTGISRCGAACIAVGNGTAGDASGAVDAANIAPVYGATGTLQTNAHIVTGSGTLSGSTLAITLSGAAVFTSSSSYSCTANSTDNSTVAFGFTYASGASFSAFGDAATTPFRYTCTGN